MDTSGHSFLESCKMGVEQIREWLSLIAPLGLIAFILFNIKGFIKGFQDHDGRWSVSDISKVVIIGLIIYMVNKDANRTHEWRYFSDPVYFSFILGLFALAELKDIVKLIHEMFLTKLKGKKDEQTDDS